VGVVRVIAGEMGGRRLTAPPGRGTRPTSDRVREAAFSMLESFGALDGAKVWDLFAGSGAMGIEALSRGAAHVTFVDHASGPVSATRANLARLGYGSARASVVRDEVLNWATAAAGRQPERPSAEEAGAGAADAVDLVMADPPYAWQGWGTLLAVLAPLEPLLLAEAGEGLDLPEGWLSLRSKRYGGSVVTLASSNEVGR
jgi:16S rRNA (guanine966-N2)-methyltransferase